MLAGKPSEWQPPLCSLLFLPARVNHWHPVGVVKLSDRESICRVLAGLKIPAVNNAFPRKCECAAGSWSVPLDACLRQLVECSRLDKHHRHILIRIKMGCVGFFGGFVVAVFTCQFLFSFPSSGNVWRCQHSFLLRAKHTCGGNAGWTSLHVVIGAGWFLQHKHTHTLL